jgi:hypothetical protein
VRIEVPSPPISFAGSGSPYTASRNGRQPLPETSRSTPRTIRLGFELNLSRSKERFAALLLIAVLSFFVLWLWVARRLLASCNSTTRPTPVMLALCTLCSISHA